MPATSRRAAAISASSPNRFPPRSPSARPGDPRDAPRRPRQSSSVGSRKERCLGTPCVTPGRRNRAPPRLESCTGDVERVCCAQILEATCSLVAPTMALAVASARTERPASRDNHPTAPEPLGSGWKWMIGHRRHGPGTTTAGAEGSGPWARPAWWSAPARLLAKVASVEENPSGKSVLGIVPQIVP